MVYSTQGSQVLAFNIFNSEIPAGSGTLTNVSFDSVTAGSTSLYLSHDDGFYVADEAPLNVVADGGVLNHGDPDCANVYYGDAVLDNCGTCDDNADNDCTQDCNDEWGGTATLDDCGVCYGGNADQDCDGV